MIFALWLGLALFTAWLLLMAWLVSQGRAEHDDSAGDDEQ